MTMSTIGYGDIVPVTTTERLLCVFACVVGSMLFTYGITQLISQLADTNSDDAAFRRLLEDLSHYFEAHNVPKKLRTRCRDYVLFRRHASNFSFQELPVQEMSPALRGELLMHVNKQMLNRSPNLFDGPTSFVYGVANKLKQCCFGPEDLVLIEDMSSSDCLFIGAQKNATQLCSHSARMPAP